MKDRRLARLDREGQVAPQVGQLVGERGERAVVSRPVSPIATTRGSEASPAISVHAAASASAAAWGWTPTAASSQLNAVDEVEGRARRGQVPAGDQDPLDAGQPRRADDLVAVVVEAVGLEVAVRIDEPHPGQLGTVSAGSTSSRGKSGTGAVSVPDSAAWARPAQLVEERRSAVAVRSVRVGVAQLGEHARSDARHERCRREGHQPARLDEVAEHVAEPLTRRGVTAGGRLGEDPRLLGIDDLVGGADELPEQREGLVEQAALEPLAVVRQERGPGLAERGSGRRPRCRTGAGQVAAGHRHGPVHEVPEVVGEVGVVAPDERIPADVGVAVERDLAQGHVAGAVGAEGRNDVASGSRKLPRLLLIRSPPWASSQPWTQTRRGASSPALQSIAGQLIVWNRAMSLPITWRSAGHQWAKASGSSGSRRR